MAGAIGSGGGSGAGAFGGQIIVQNWWNAFTPWTGMEGEPPLLEGLSFWVLGCRFMEKSLIATVDVEFVLEQN